MAQMPFQPIVNDVVNSCVCGQQFCHCSCQQTINSLLLQISQLSLERNALQTSLYELQMSLHLFQQSQSQQSTNFQLDQFSSNHNDNYYPHVSCNALANGGNELKAPLINNINYISNKISESNACEEKNEEKRNGIDNDNKQEKIKQTYDFDTLQKIVQLENDIESNENHPLFIDAMSKINNIKDEQEIEHFINVVSSGMLKLVIEANVFAQKFFDNAVNNVVMPQLQSKFLKESKLEMNENNLLLFNQCYSNFINTQITKHEQWFKKYCKLLYCIGNMMENKKCGLLIVRENLFELIIFRDKFWIKQKQDGNDDLDDIFDKHLTQYMARLIDEKLLNIVKQIRYKKEDRYGKLCYFYSLDFSNLVKQIYESKDRIDDGVGTDCYGQKLKLLKKYLTKQDGYNCRKSKHDCRQERLQREKEMQRNHFQLHRHKSKQFNKKQEQHTQENMQPGEQNEQRNADEVIYFDSRKEGQIMMD